jgi:hypothetical protein
MRQSYRFAAPLLAIALIAVGGCGPANPYDDLYRGQQAGDVRVWQSSFAKGYFPPNFGKPEQVCGDSNPPLPVIGEVEAAWFPRQWEAAKEPSFYRLSLQKPPPEFALRFSYIPSFTPSIFIRVHKKGSDYQLIAKTMSGAGGYDPGTISMSKEMRLSKLQVRELERLLEDGKFFIPPPVECGMGHFDGSEWVFEEVSNSGYKMVKHWSPEKGSAHDLGTYLVELSGLSFDPY